ncbi:hypothetical protein [Aureimonas sp. AU12]|uniref:hypothetical protein n=1 Tax=Aureimonas sp. AU12 TaxID=1638161 RepID=UPI000A6EFAA5|nr:hypothetical protein [Aureimonas sp. AU12]
MPASKPTLGYASRSDACRALRAKGLSNAQIAARIGVRQTIVASLLWKGYSDKKREAPPRQAAPTVTAARSGMSVQLMNEINELFPYHQRVLVRRHATARGMSTQQLIQAIVEKVVADDLVDAVLDDGVAS